MKSEFNSEYVNFALRKLNVCKYFLKVFNFQIKEGIGRTHQGLRQFQLAGEQLYTV